ncbi:MAG: NADP-dependent isocitrate dehydrogenase [Phycisphaerae bacterium]|nr:NADP-dependent isocitrate dehydrogenase [Phycisphaerae bacterium]
MPANPVIIYTHTDEAPMLATYSFLPILRMFTAPAHIDVETRDISLSGRIIAAFPERLKPEQRINDDLAEVGQMCLTPEANVVKLPNVSASVPQLKAAVDELRSQGYDLPEYVDEPTTPAAKDARARYARIQGSAVNPVIREGNSDRRATKSVKDYARANPHKMGAWSLDSETHVAAMSKGDFFGNEQSVTIPAATTVRIELVGNDGATTVLKDGLKLAAGEIFDGTFLSAAELVQFLAREVAIARHEGVLFSLHLKATMMKVSDPIIFGHAVKVYFKSVFEKHAATLAKLGVDVNNGFGDLLAKIATLPSAEREAIEADINAVYAAGPAIAMVDSDKGITNLHVPSDIIVDASMPAMIREGGKMWNAAGKTQDVKAVIPDRSYAGVYQAIIDFCRTHGAFDPKTMGSVPNVGLMAQKAEEYGSHDKTFEIKTPGTVRVVDASGAVLMQHHVERDDIWRACQTKDPAIRDWVKLAVTRARLSQTPAVFWLDGKRPHDRELLKKVHAYLKDHDLTLPAGASAGRAIEFHFMEPGAACTFSCERMKKGLDTISVTGNVLRDYLTDLFPILELGTSAKMLSIVPLMNGGGLFETGAGGSAPKHVQQFVAESSLRWDSLGEFQALGASFEHLFNRTGNAKAAVLAETMDQAIAQYLMNNKGPARKVGELDNRGSHFYLALYWAQALAKQTKDEALASYFAPIASALSSSEAKIVGELNGSQGKPVNIGGYYHPSPELAAKAVRSSPTLNAIVENAGRTVQMA